VAYATQDHFASSDAYLSSPFNKPDHISYEENEIRETVFRYMFPDGAQKDEPGTLALLCISFDKNGPDPTDAFMARFTGHKPPVRKASHCKWGKNGGVIDRGSGKPAAFYHVPSINWISVSKAEAYGESYLGTMGATGFTYIVEKINGKWLVTKDEGGWISYIRNLKFFSTISLNKEKAARGPPIPLRIEKSEAVHQTGGDPDVVLQSNAAGTQHHPVELSSADR